MCKLFLSHPGYGCWLSGIDVNTQAVQQKHNDPYLAVVVSTSAVDSPFPACRRSFWMLRGLP